MARTYERRKYPGRGRGRMLRAVALRAEGKSLRQIAAVLKVSHQTVANDLARAAAETRLSRLPVKKMSPGATFLTGEIDGPGAEVVPLRSVRQLADYMQVSPATVRRDLLRRESPEARAALEGG